jgi:glycosyltransferase involved in cell wall biosynthesis
VHSTEKGRTLGNGSDVVSNIESRGGQIADRIITVSYMMKNELTRLGFPAEKIRVCYNGVDPEKYKPERVSQEKIAELRNSYGIKDNESMVLFIGRLVGVKGVDNLILAMPHVLEKAPNVKLVIVGLGGMQSYLEALVEKHKLQDSVKFRFEFVPEQERIAHYAACDVSVFPSLYEPFGIVALEAMSMEKPVVVGATDASGMKEIVIPNGPDQCGFHIDPNNPADIAWGIVNAVQDSQRKIQLGKNGRRRVLQKFTWNSAAAKTAEFYNELTEKNPEQS